VKFSTFGVTKLNKENVNNKNEKGKCFVFILAITKARLTKS